MALTVKSLDRGAVPTTQGPIVGPVGTGKAAIVENNVVELTATSPLAHHYSGLMKHFNNQTPDGLLLLGYFGGEPDAAPPRSPRAVNELATDANLALLCAT
jgi:hypothetical protein